MSESAPEQEKPRRPIRDLIEGLGIALLMAVFYKYFAIEAYQIPTSSMQPTMMGSSTARVYDRLIVDKTRFLFTEPQMWDIAVFKYPIRENQNYVKRMVGMPGTKLRIAGGNVYQVTSGDGSAPEHLTVQRKPADLQESIWKEIFPARRAVLGGNKLIDTYFDVSRGEWSERDDVLRCKPGRSSRPKLKFYVPGGRAVVNEVWDGYPSDVAKQIQEKESTPLAGEQVQDVRFAFTLTPQSTPDALELAIEIDRETQDNLSFAFQWEKGRGKLVVIEGKATAASSESIDLALAGGSSTRLRLAHYDDLLTLEVDGDLVSSLECSGFKTLTPPKLVTPIATVTGGGELRYEELVVERDLHYMPSSRPGNQGWSTKVVEVPEGHYMMLGDNTLQSVDSRDWTGIEIGVLDGRIVDPRQHPEAKKMIGNLRPVTLDESPDADENPLPISSLGKIVFTDRAGEVYTLDGQVNLDSGETGGVWGRDGAWFLDDEGRPWHPEQSLIQFVPREHIIGRPLINFWPCGLLGPFRLGLIK